MIDQCFCFFLAQVSSTLCRVRQPYARILFLTTNNVSFLLLTITGELDVVLREARNLPVWGFPGQSNPYCRLILGEQVSTSVV